MSSHLGQPAVEPPKKKIKVQGKSLFESQPSALLAIRVYTPSGAELSLTVTSSMLGRELVQKVRQSLPKPRTTSGFATLKLFFGEHGLETGQSLAEQNIQDDAECLCLLKEVTSEQQETVIDRYLHEQALGDDDSDIWEAVEILTLHSQWSEKVQKGKVTLPSGLQTLTFGYAYNQSLEKVTLPSGLQTLTFGYAYNQSLEKVTLPSGLQTLTFGRCYNQSLEKVTLPSGLQTLTLSHCYNQSLEQVNRPSGLVVVFVCDTWRVMRR